MERSKLLAAAFLAGAFTLGATVGFGFDRTIAVPATATAASSYDSFASELGLTPEQRAAVDTILDARHRTIDSLLVPVRPQIDAARDGAQREIAARLSAPQREKYEAYLARRQRESGHRRAPAGSPASPAPIR